MKNIFLNGLNNVAPAEQKLGLETQIDQLVYQLYELTDEEIKIVEGNG